MLFVLAALISAVFWILNQQAISSINQPDSERSASQYNHPLIATVEDGNLRRHTNLQRNSSATRWQRSRLTGWDADIIDKIPSPSG